MKRAVIVVVVAALLIAAMGVPYPVVIAPRWRVEVLDASQRPVAGQRVDEIWAYYALQRLADREKRETDANGVVEFPERTRRISGLQVLRGAVARISETGAHASFGIDATVIVWGEGGAVLTKDKAKRRDGMLHSVVVLTE